MFFRSLNISIIVISAYFKVNQKIHGALLVAENYKKLWVLSSDMYLTEQYVWLPDCHNYNLP